jgi:hypothetical protein
VGILKTPFFFGAAKARPKKQSKARASLLQEISSYLSVC